MKNNQNETNKNKWIYIIPSLLIVGGGISGSLYLKNMNLDNEHISKGENNSISNTIKADINLVDIKDFANSNQLLGESLNKFVSYGKLLSDDFLYLKRDSSFKKLELYRVNKNGELVQNINIEGDGTTELELNSAIELSDESLILQIEEYIPDMETSIYYLRRYNKNGDLEFNKVLDNNSDILNLHSSKDINGFLSTESDSDGNINIVKYNFNGEEAFKYKIGYDYISNIDVIFKENKISFISKEDDCNIIELDENGKEINKINIPYDDIRINKLFPTSDSGYIISFTKNNVDDYENIESCYLKINSQGKEEWIHSEKVNSSTKAINEIDDGYILFSNDFYYEANDDDTNVLNLYSISKIDKSGNRAWIKHINANDELNSSIFTINGTYIEDKFLVVSGILEDFENNAHYIRFSIDKDGNLSNVHNEDNNAVG